MSEEQDPVTEPEPEFEDSGKTFSQAEVNRIMTREKDQGKRSGRREVLDTLGFKSVDEAQSFSQQLADAESAKLSEADRVKKEADIERQEAAKERQEAKIDRYQARLERQLSSAGVEDAHIERIARLVDSDVDSTDEEITASVAELKASMPQLFAPAKQDAKPPTGDPGKASSKKPESDPMKRANDRLQARHGAKLQSNSKA